MTTFDTDVVRVHLSVGLATIPLSKLGLSWPPPERLYLEEGGGIRPVQDGDLPTFIMKRTSMSALNDEAVDRFEHRVARGAIYEYEVQHDALGD